MATLKEFLQTGALGAIHLGMSDADVTDLLGEPTDKSVAQDPRILKYGGMQLAFIKRPDAADRRLANIGLYFAPRTEPIPESVRPEDFQGTPETTMDEVREFLDESGLVATADVESEDANYLILPSGARITFDDKKLYSIHFATRTFAPDRKQISLTISTETWTHLREMARNSKRPVSELCAEWITERAKEGQQNVAGGVES